MEKMLTLINSLISPFWLWMCLLYVPGSRWRKRGTTFLTTQPGAETCLPQVLWGRDGSIHCNQNSITNLSAPWESLTGGSQPSAFLFCLLNSSPFASTLAKFWLLCVHSLSGEEQSTNRRSREGNRWESLAWVISSDPCKAKQKFGEPGMCTQMDEV